MPVLKVENLLIKINIHQLIQTDQWCQIISGLKVNLSPICINGQYRIVLDVNGRRERRYWLLTSIPIRGGCDAVATSLGTKMSTGMCQGRLLLHILAAIAEFERELILSRITEGRRQARARGVKFGRKFKLTPHQRSEAIARLKAGATQADVARSYAVHPAMICRLAAMEN
jgi:Resolvase, N terminal domain